MSSCLRSSRLVPLVLAASTATGALLVTAPAGGAASKYHQCGNGTEKQQLYPWVSSVKGVSKNKACSTIVALGKSVGDGKFPSLELLITCGPVQTDATGAETGPGVATLKQTTFRGWSLTYSTNAGLKLTKGSASFHAGQQDFGCY